MRVPPKNTKSQLSGIISYLCENGKNSLSQHKSVSAVVAKLLDDWSELPEDEKRRYIDSESNKSQENKDKTKDKEHKS